MKKILLIGLLVPALAGAQTKTTDKTKPVTTTATTADGFVIEGDISGFPDGTNVALMNGQTGAPENETTITANKFTLKGKLAAPDFKILLFNKQPPYVTLFLDNSTLKLSGTKDALDRTVITGSVAQSDFEKLNMSLSPYQKLFMENAEPDPAGMEKALTVSETFVKEHPTSYISAMAVIRYHQLAGETGIGKTEALFNTLSAPVKASSMGNYIAQQITEAKRNAIGSVLPDFTQADTTGKPLSLSAYRGKFVLIDFWASWCRPCRGENPNVVANYNKYKDKNFTVLGVSLDKAKPAWIDAIHQDGLTWPHVSDLLGWSNAVAQKFQIVSIPQNFLIDPDGKIIGKNLRGTALERKLEEVLK